MRSSKHQLDNEMQEFEKKSKVLAGIYRQKFNPNFTDKLKSNQTNVRNAERLRYAKVKESSVIGSETVGSSSIHHTIRNAQMYPTG